MTAFRSFTTVAAASCMALLAAQGEASAGAFGVREQSATALGMSFAGAASGSGGLASMFWNPATITMAPGWQSEYDATLISVRAEINPIATPTIAFGGSGELGQLTVVPAAYTSYQVNDRLWIGLTSTSPFDLVTKPRSDYAGALYGRSSRVLSLNGNLVIGYKVTDWLSVAAGPTIQGFDVRLKRASAASPLSLNAALIGDDVGYGYTAGLTLTPLAGTTLGLGFRSMIHQEVTGTLVPAPLIEIPIRANVNLPETVTFGISQLITPQFTLNGGVEFTNWSRLKLPAVVNQITLTPATALPFNYSDGWQFSLGGEYRLDDRWTVRAGVAYEMSPIDTQVRSVRVPDSDRIQVSLGAGYKWSDKLSFDAAYSHLFLKEAKIAIVPGQQDFVGLPFIADSKPSIDIVSVGLTYRWDEPAKPIAGLAPIVRKD
jgi:long-chain fatty acid transport protein